MTEASDAGMATKRQNIDKRRAKRVERLERLLIRSLYTIQKALDLRDIDLENDIREELNRGPETRLKTTTSRARREGALAAAAFQRSKGIDVVSGFDRVTGRAG